MAGVLGRLVAQGTKATAAKFKLQSRGRIQSDRAPAGGSPSAMRFTRVRPSSGSDRRRLGPQNPELPTCYPRVYLVMHYLEGV